MVDEGINVYKRFIVATDHLLETVTLLCKEYPINLVIVGDKTNSKTVQRSLAVLGIPLKSIDEHNSSREGRHRFLKDHLSGLGRWIPIGLRTPDQPFDDYVAIVLAERFFRLRAVKTPANSGTPANC